MNGVSRAGSEYGYRSVCKHCGARPFSEGPHHDPACNRRRETLATESELALSKGCQFCDGRPFVAGPHHDADC
ncbi:hypothetical protein ACFO0N_11700 [Halobium salinum]|uniref:Small CPxCG-related zinc finger protein n=1 Tax=Halobium salinum TaxID=1364940 RepID=A0ABD5PCB4_9EURY|nr:hypothetical protein [Halobium salinum]